MKTNRMSKTNNIPSVKELWLFRKPVDTITKLYECSVIWKIQELDICYGLNICVLQIPMLVS